MTNPIIEEIRAARAALAEEHGYDLIRLNEWAQKQTESRRRHSNIQPKANKALVPTAGAVLSAELTVARTPTAVATLAPSPAGGTA